MEIMQFFLKCGPILAIENLKKAQVVLALLFFSLSKLAISNRIKNAIFLMAEKKGQSSI
jgi:hypothetical protein